MPKTEAERIKVKTKDSEFQHKLENEFELSPREAQAIVETAAEVYHLKDYDPSQLADAGQIVRTVVKKDAKHGPRVEELSKTEVTLTRNIPKEDKELYRQEGKPEQRQSKILRMTEEALEQDGVLTQYDLADILEVSSKTIGRDIDDLRAKGFEVTTRGVYQDIGPGISHKTKIIKLYLEYHTYSDIQKRTRHSPSAIKRYIKNFGRVLLAFKKDFSIKETARVIDISEKLAKEYLELYMKYNTEKYQERLADIVKKVQDHTSEEPEAKKGALK